MLVTPSPQPGLLTQYWPHVCTVLVAVLGFIVLGPNSDIVAYGSFHPAGPTRTAGTLVTGRGFVRTDVYFSSGDERAPLLHGWWYRPKSARYNDKLPTVLMASGLGAQVGLKMYWMVPEGEWMGFMNKKLRLLTTALECTNNRAVPRVISILV